MKTVSDSINDAAKGCQIKDKKVAVKETKRDEGRRLEQLGTDVASIDAGGTILQNP